MVNIRSLGAVFALLWLGLPDLRLGDRASHVAATETVPSVLEHTASAQPGLDESHCLARAMLIHDLSIFSLEWHCEVQQEIRPDEWQTFGILDHGMDEMGRWWGTSQFGRSTPGGGMSYFTVHTWTTDNLAQTLFNEDSGVVVVQPPDRTALWYANPMMFIGRTVGTWGVRRLGELLLASEDLRVLIPENDRGIVRLGATVHTGGMMADMLVDVDTSQDFAPVRIETRDALMLFPVEVLTVTRFERRDGIVIPVEGRRETNYVGELNEADSAALENALTEEGVDFRGQRPDPRDPDVRRGYQAAVRRAFAAGCVPHLPVSHAHRFVNTRIISVNTELDPKKLTPRHEGSKHTVSVFDGTLDGVPIENPDDALPGGGE